MATIDIPEAAFQWMLGDEPVAVMNLGTNRKIITTLLKNRHQVLAIDPDPKKIAKLRARFPRAISHNKLLPIAGHIEALPVRPQVSDIILLNSALDYGSDNGKADMNLVLGQLARALNPGGYVTGMQFIRDDTVPWVRRLISVMRTVDPQAMPGKFSDPQIEKLLASKYFPEQDEKEFRVWVPVSVDGLIEMVSRQTFFQRQNHQVQKDLLAATRQIYHNASSNDELRLPFVAKCWRAYVHQNELTTPISFDGDALRIWLD